MADYPAKKDKTADTTIKDALERFRESQDGTEHSREAYEKDTEFGRLAEQWPEKIRRQREAEGRPALTINKLPSFVRQVINESRQNKPSINVHPVDNGADKDTAEVINGLVRSIERNGTGADVAYDTAIDHAVSGGFGFFEIGIDYAHADTFALECRINRIANPLMVHWDANTTQFDASDWDYAFVSDLLTKKQFEKRYPKANPVSFEGDDNDDAAAHWTEDDKVRVARYWLRTEDTRTLIEFRTPKGVIAIREGELAKLGKNAAAAGGLDLGGQVKDDQIAAFYVQMMQWEEARRREVKYHKVHWRTITGVEVLDEDEWPGSTIPICPVWGEEVVLKGKRHFRSMIRDAKDPQMMFNFWRSASTELVALAPRAPWVGPKGFVPKGMEEKWQTANTRSHAYLEYDTIANAAPPQRTPFAGIPAGALQESLNANDDMKSIIGIYDPSLGARSNETSGKAILARQKESDVSNFHFIDNLSRAIRYCGQVLVEIIPSVYTPQETVRILGADMQEKVVRLVGEGRQGVEPAVNPETGEPERLYDLSIGKYDVTVKTGPSYGTQREETREVLVEIMRAVPAAAPVLGDVLMEHMDFQGADKVAERLKALLPPQIQQMEGIKSAAPQGPAPNPLEDEERKAKIESLRAGAVASLAKAGQTQTDQQLAVFEAVLQALQTSGPDQPNPGAPQAPPGQPAGQPQPAG